MVFWRVKVRVGENWLFFLFSLWFNEASLAVVASPPRFWLYPEQTFPAIITTGSHKYHGFLMALSSPTDGSALLLLLNFELSHHFLFALLVLWTLQIICILNSLHWTLWLGFCCPDQTLDNRAILIKTVWDWHTYKKLAEKDHIYLWLEFAL